MRALLVDKDFSLVEGAVVAVLALVGLFLQVNSSHVFILKRFRTQTFIHVNVQFNISGSSTKSWGLLYICPHVEHCTRPCSLFSDLSKWYTFSWCFDFAHFLKKIMV